MNSNDQMARSVSVGDSPISETGSWSLEGPFHNSPWEAGSSRSSSESTPGSPLTPDPFTGFPLSNSAPGSFTITDMTSRMYQSKDVHIFNVAITGFVEMKKSKKDRRRSSDFAYVIQVHWSDGRITYVKRTYRDFFVLHYTLLEAHPPLHNSHDDNHNINGFRHHNGLPNGRQSILPLLPARKSSQESNRALAESRELELNKYVKELVKLHAKVSKSPLVLDFFETRHGTDPKPLNRPEAEDWISPESPDYICYM